MNQQKDSEIIILMDDSGWRWKLCEAALKSSGPRYTRLKANTSIKHSWHRIENSAFILVHWGGDQISGASILEQIKACDPKFDIAEKVIILMENPTQEDVIYFAELGIYKTVNITSAQKNLEISIAEIQKSLKTIEGTKEDIFWRKFISLFNNLPPDPSPAIIEKLEAKLLDFQKKTGEKESSRFLDLKGSILLHKKDVKAAEECFKGAIEKNPKYFRAQNNLVTLLRKQQRYHEALTLLKSLHEQNKLNIQRMATMGQVWVDLKDDAKAEHYFKSSLERDRSCDEALNGMADIRFRQNRLEEAKIFLAKSESASYAARKFNNKGIELVKLHKYREALDHYKKAQYVLPQQEKGSMLYYNIGLCYSRWGRYNLAREYLNLALVKDPGYKKARRLLRQIEDRVQQHLSAS